MKKLITLTLLLLSLVAFSQERKNLEIDFEFTSLNKFEKDFNYYYYNSYTGEWKGSKQGLGIIGTFTALIKEEEYFGLIVVDRSVRYKYPSIKVDPYSLYNYRFIVYDIKDLSKTIEAGQEVEIKPFSSSYYGTSKESRTINFKYLDLDELNKDRGLKMSLSEKKRYSYGKITLIKYEKFLRFKTDFQRFSYHGSLRTSYFEVEGTSMYNILNAQTCENSKIYPNPSSSNKPITVKNDSLITKIEILDLSGKSVLTKEYNDYSINLILDSSFKAGVYIIKINNECTRKFIFKG